MRRNRETARLCTSQWAHGRRIRCLSRGCTALRLLKGAGAAQLPPLEGLPTGNFLYAPQEAGILKNVPFSLLWRICTCMAVGFVAGYVFRTVPSVVFICLSCYCVRVLMWFTFLFLVFADLGGAVVSRGISERLREVSRLYLLYLPGIYSRSSSENCA